MTKADIKIVNMNELSEAQIIQAAQLLTDSIPLGWANLAEAMEEIKNINVPENTMLVALYGEEVAGWGGILEPQYDGKVFELHPLAVRDDMRGMGIGSQIVEALESTARKQGGLTMWLGADDEKEGGETSFANVDLYENLGEKIDNFNAGTHQTAFYLKQGYKVVGVMPDANGIGKPDIYMAKKL